MQKAANKAIRFIEPLPPQQRDVMVKIKLELWQKAIVSVILTYRTQKNTYFP